MVFHPTVRSVKDIGGLVTVGVGSCQLLDHDFTVPPYQLYEATH